MRDRPKVGCDFVPRSASRSTVIFLAVLLKDTPPNKGRMPERGDITTTATFAGGGIVMRRLFVLRNGLRSPNGTPANRDRAPSDSLRITAGCALSRSEDRLLLTTYISGGVYSTNMGTWSAAGSPYVLQSDVKLEGSAGALTILSNVQVQGSGRLLVDDNGSGGSLTAQGRNLHDRGLVVRGRNRFAHGRQLCHLQFLQ